MTNEELAALLTKLDGEATPGPWTAADWTEDDGPNRTTVEAHEPELSAAGFAIVPKYATDAMVRHANEMEDLSGGISFEDAWLAMVIASESALTASKENT